MKSNVFNDAAQDAVVIYGMRAMHLTWTLYWHRLKLFSQPTSYSLSRGALSALIVSYFLLGCASTSIYDAAQHLEQEGKYEEAGDIWLKDANAKLEKRSFSAFEFSQAAKNFDKVSKRASDAISARRLAAIRYIKEAEYNESQLEYFSAFMSYKYASEIYKSVNSEKDLGDQDSAERARIKAVTNLDLAMRTRDGMLDSNTLDIMRYQYEYLAKLVIADQEKSEAYKRRGDAHLKALRDYMPTATLNAQAKAASDAAEERARREKSARHFANAIGAATAVMQGTKSTGAAPTYSSNSQTRQGEIASGACTTEACYVALCKKNDGQPATIVSAEGCRKVHCNGLGSRGWMQVIYAPKGSGCVSLVK